MAGAIVDVATALGSQIVTNDDLQAEHGDWNMAAVERSTGVAARRVAAEGETALDLAEAACRRLLERNPELAAGVDLLVVCTQTSERQVPADACVLHGRLGLPGPVGAFDLGAACSGYVYGLSVADAMIAAGRADHVLLVTAETYSKLLDPDDRATRSLFGDGASATWIRRSTGTEGIVDVAWATRGDATAALQTDPPRWSDPAARPRLAMDGKAIVSFSYGAVPDQVLELLERNGLAVGDVDVFALHQASELVLRGIQDRLGLPAEVVPRAMAQVGNTVSTSIPLLLEARREAGGLPSGTLAVLSGFGAGLSWASALVRF
jgi:3-oxoacyl-[acyl-carrier-protein] synthase-3